MNDSNRNTDKAAVEKDGGLYKNLNISVRSLSLVILAGLALLILLMFMGTRQGGYTVSYDARGGSDVASQTVRYHDPLELPQPPTRQGYVFDGWYLDENLTEPAQSGMLVESSLELYAAWKPSE